MKTNMYQKLQRFLGGALAAVMMVTSIPVSAAVQEREASVVISGLGSLHDFSEAVAAYPQSGKTDLAKGKTVIVSSEHNANLVWNQMTDGNDYIAGNPTDNNRWAPRGYGVNDLLEDYGADRQGPGPMDRWEFAAVDLGSKQTLEEIDLYFAELPGAYRVYLWDGENPVKPDGEPFTGNINGTYTGTLSITGNTATRRYKDSYFHEFLPENFKITEEEVNAGKTFADAGFTLVRDFSYSLTGTVTKGKTDLIRFNAPVEARYVIYEQLKTHNNLGTFGGSLRGVAVYAPQDKAADSIAVTSPKSNQNKVLDLTDTHTFDVTGTYSSGEEGNLSLKVTAKGPDLYNGKAKEEAAAVSNVSFRADGTWSATIPKLDIYGNLTLEIELVRDGESVAETSVSNLAYRGRQDLARAEGARAIAVNAHSGYPTARLNDGVFAPADNNTRWSVTGNVDGAGATNVWVGADLGADKEFDRIVLHEWDGRTSEFVVEYARDGEIEDPNNNSSLNADGWTVVKTGTTVGSNKVIDFPAPVTGRYVRVRTTAYSKAQPGFTEFEVYKAENPEIDADGLGAPVLPEGNTGKVILPEIANGEVKLYGSDNKQIIDMERNFYRPLVTMSVNVMYEARLTANGKTGTSEKDTNVVVPGRYSDCGVNPAPLVVPGIREWYGSAEGGSFTLSKDTRIAAGGGEAAVKAVEKVKAFFADMLKFDLKDADSADDKDIEMIFDESLLAELGEEGYYLAIGDKITIKAATETGLLYGGVTLTQIFYASDDRLTAPRGEARDYPKYGVRSAMIDVGRTYYPLAHLREVGRYMAWFKMNNLEVHLNDNWGNSGYAAFRLENEKYPLTKYNGDKNNPGGANEGYYTKEEYRDFQKELAEYGIEVINEIDTPAHSAIFGRLAESEGRPPMRTEEHMNVDGEENRKAVEAFVLSLIDEYISGDDPVFINRTVHFGGDEYSGSADNLALYNMEMAQMLLEKGVKVRMWSSTCSLSGNIDSEIISNPNVMLNLWHPQELAAGGGVKAAYAKGYNVINTSNFVYIDPANFNGYPDRYGGVYYAGSSDPSDYTFEHIYDVFNVNNTYSPRRGNQGSALMPLAHPQTKGAQVSMWHDLLSYNGGLSQFDLFDRFRDGVMMMSEKTWYGEQTEGQTWEAFEQRIEKQGNRAAGVNPARFVESIGDVVAAYEFNAEKPLADNSANNYDAAVTGTYTTGNSGIELPDGSSLKLPFDSIGFPYSVSLKAKLGEVAENTVLFAGEDGILYANYNGTGNLGYVRGEYGLAYEFEYKTLTTKIVGTETQPVTLSTPRVETVEPNLIKAEEWFDLALVTEETYPVHSNTASQFRAVKSWTDVALYVNGERIVGRATNVKINNGKTFKNSGGIGKRSNTVYDSTSFVLPTERILPDGKAVVSSLSIYNRDLSAEEVKALYQANVLVEFESNGGTDVKSVKPGVGQTLKAPNAPEKSGYTFAGWYQDEALTEGWNFDSDTVSGDMTLYAKWENATEDSTKNFKVTVDGVLKGEYAYNTKVTVEAEDKENFAGWKLDGAIVSREASYTFYVMGDMELTAVYGEAVQEPRVVISNVLAIENGEKTNLRFPAQIVVPEGYKLLEAGMLWSSKDGTVLKIGEADVKNTAVKAVNTQYQFSVTINGVPGGRFVRGAMYAKLQTPDGEEVYYYSAEKKGIAK